MINFDSKQVEGQAHARLKMDLEAWQRRRSQPPWLQSSRFLSASLYVSKRGAYRDRLCRDVVGRWLVGWLVVTRVHCGQTVHPRPIVTMEH